MSGHAPGHAPGGELPPVRNFFIRRPIFSTVISIVIVLLGVFAITSLPVALYPQITPPSVLVTTVYPGATAEDVAEAVAAPIEQQLSGLDGLLYFQSSNGADGTMNLYAYFDIGRSQDLAAVDVQNQLKLAEPQLPQEVRRNGVTVKKAQKDILLMIALSSDDPRHDAEFLNNYSKINLDDEVKRIKGVGDAYTYGLLEFSMLLKLDPDRMAQLGLGVADVVSAVQEQNTTNPGGRVGRQPSPPGTDLTLPVTTQGRLKTEAEFDRIILHANPDGSVVRLGDVGRADLAGRSYDLDGRVNGKSTALLLVYTRAGANALEVKQNIVARLTELQRAFPPGLRWDIVYDTTPFITASIEEVLHTLAEAMVLVTLVVFLFLQDWRSTVIPILAVPVSIVGTFAGMQLLGFSINLLTLFGLVLAIGIVVDDAIVVIENVERIMSEDHLPPPQAADKAMSQVSGALVAIVLVLSSVFIPVALLAGITGAMFKQFAITIVVSVILSGIVALTLTPALCALLLKPHVPGKKKFVFFEKFNEVFDAITAKYLGGVRGVIGRPRTFLAAFAVLLVLIVVLFRAIPTGFIPTEDKGYFGIALSLPEGASRQRTDALVGRIEETVRKHPAVENVISLVGLDFINNANLTSAAAMFVMLKPWEEREADGLDINSVIGAVNRELAGMKEGLSFAGGRVMNLSLGGVSIAAFHGAPPFGCGVALLCGMVMNLKTAIPGAVIAFPILTHRAPSDEHDGLIAGNVESFAAAGVGADHLIVRAHQVVRRLGEFGALQVGGAGRDGFLLRTPHPADLELIGLAAFRAGVGGLLDLGGLGVEIFLVHNPECIPERRFMPCPFRGAPPEGKRPPADGRNKEGVAGHFRCRQPLEFFWWS